MKQDNLTSKITCDCVETGELSALRKRKVGNNIQNE